MKLAMDESLEGAYLREILFRAVYARIARKRMEQHLKRDEVFLFFCEIQNFLSHAAAISRLLWPTRGRSAEAHARGQARGIHLRKVLQVSDSDPLQKRTLRDHLEHFDERLDAWCEESEHHNVVDLHIGALSSIGGKIQRTDFLRVYEPDRAVFTFRGEEFDINALAASMERIAQMAEDRAEQSRERSILYWLKSGGLAGTQKVD